MEHKICQSCGMPLNDAGFFGTNADDSRNEDYCVYCFALGDFTEDITLDEMVENCADFVDAYNSGAPKALTREEYVEKLRGYLPTLKRWKTE